MHLGANASLVFRGPKRRQVVCVSGIVTGKSHEDATHQPVPQSSAHLETPDCPSGGDVDGASDCACYVGHDVVDDRMHF